MRRIHKRLRRRGISFVWTVLMLVPLLAFVALAVDLGLVMSARSQCQIAADASAMAGVRALNGDSASNFNYSSAVPTAKAAVTDNSILSTPIQPSQLNVEVGHYTYDDNAQKFEPQIPGPTTGPWSLVKTTVSYSGIYAFARPLGLNAFNTAATATAVHRPRDVCVVVDLSGSMRFDSLLGIKNSGSRSMSNNPESVFPLFGHYSDVSGAGLQNPNSQTVISGKVYGSANVTDDTNSGPPIVDDFYQDIQMTVPAFSAAPDGYATVPAGDVPLRTNANTGSTYARTASWIIFDNNTTRQRNDSFSDWEIDGYETYVPSFSGYTVGPRHWGKTFWIWPPDPRPNQDWRRLYFQWPGSNIPLDDNSRLFANSGYFRAPGNSSYAINYGAIINWIKNVGPNPFPPSLRAGGILYYSEIPDSFTTINTGATLPTFPNNPSTQRERDERFWKDYIDYVFGFKQNGSGGSYSDRTSRVGYGSEFSWSGVRVSSKPTAGSTYGSPPAYMDYRDSPRRPKTHFWFGPMTMIDYMGNYNLSTFWWPGTCHEAPSWQCKIGIQAAIQDIKNNHPNDYVSLIFFSHPMSSPNGSSGRFNRARAPMGQGYDRMIKSLWYPPYVLDNPGSEISPYDTDPAKIIRESPNSQGGTCYAMGLMLAYNQFSSAPLLRTYNTSAGAPYGDAGGLGRKGAAKLLIFETDGMPTYTAQAGFTSGGANNSYYHVRAPDEFPYGVNNEGSSGTLPTTQAYDIVDRITALDDDDGYSTERKPVIIHCLGFGTLFEPGSAGSTQNAALQRLQEMQYRGGRAGGEQPHPSTPLPSYKRIVGSSDDRIEKLREAFINIMQDGVQVTLIE